MGKQSITMDANVATSFYLSNIPDSLDAKGLWKACVSYGRLVDAYIANKLSKGGKIFGFIRFLGIKDASDFVKSLSNIWIDNFHLYVLVARFHRANHTGSQPINKVLKIKTNPKPNANPNSLSFQNTKPHPSFASVLHNKPNPATTTPSQAITHLVILNDHDLISVEDSSIVILVKLKDVESMSNMYTIYDSIDTSSHIDVNEIEKVADSVEENLVDDLNDLNDNFNEMSHGINEDEVGESSDPSQPPGFEHMKKSFSNTSKCSTSFARHHKKDIKGVSIIHELNRIIEVGTTLGFDVRGCVQESKMTRLELFRLKNMWGNFNFDYACSMAPVPKILPDIYITALDRLWSDHTPILFHISKSDFGPIPFKLYNSWLSRDGFDDAIKAAWYSLENNNNDGRILKSHEKLRCQIDRKKIDDGIATPSDRDTRMQLLQEIDKLDNFEALDLIQKAHIKWDIEGNKNLKFFHGLINQKRKYQSIKGIMHDGVWITDPIHIKELFLNFFKDKFQVHDSQVVFPPLVHSFRLCPLDREYLETHISLDEIKSAIWDCEFANSFFDSRSMPQGANSSFFTLIPKVSNPIFIKDFRPISLIGIHYKIITKILANQLSKVIDKIVSIEQSAFILRRQILDGPLILSEVIEWFKKRRGKMLIFKVDFEKAFDSVSWKYLDFVLHSLVSDDEVSNMARNSGCAAGSFHFTYLGLPIWSTMNRISSWKTLIDRFQSRLSSWKACDASDFVKSLSNIWIDSFHLYVSVARFQRANHTGSQPINKVLKAETNPKPNPNPNSSSFQNTKPHPSFAFVLHNKPNSATTTPSQAITHSVILNDHDLISVGLGLLVRPISFI
ncbi:putative RNA-directed DNA polymerase, eukaryota, reverse transcriptase zinc-binding domain protein [Tanacetum coccineum]